MFCVTDEYHILMMEEYSWHVIHTCTCRLVRVALWIVISLLRLRGHDGDTSYNSKKAPILVCLDAIWEALYSHDIFLRQPD